MIPQMVGKGWVKAGEAVDGSSIYVRGDDVAVEIAAVAYKADAPSWTILLETFTADALSRLLRTTAAQVDRRRRADGW